MVEFVEGKQQPGTVAVAVRHTDKGVQSKPDEVDTKLSTLH